MKRPGQEITLIRLVARNLGRDRGLWAFTASCVALCVFVQCLFLGIDAGIEHEVAVEPANFENPDAVAGAMHGWTVVVFAVTSAVIAMLLSSSMATLFSERRRMLGILRAIGISRGQVRDLVAIEAAVAAVLALVIGLGAAMAVGMAWKSTFLAQETLTAFSAPFVVSIWLTYPVLVILFTLTITIISIIHLQWRKPVVEVLGYE